MNTNVGFPNFVLWLFNRKLNSTKKGIWIKCSSIFWFSQQRFHPTESVTQVPSDVCIGDRVQEKSSIFQRWITKGTWYWLVLRCSILARGWDAKEFNQVAREIFEPKRIWLRNTDKGILEKTVYMGEKKQM